MQILYVFIMSYMGTIKIQVVGRKYYIDANMLSKCFMEAMGTIKIQVVGWKSYIDENMLSKCFMEAFEEIKEASIHPKLWNLNLSEIWEC